MSEVIQKKKSFIPPAPQKTESPKSFTPPRIPSKPVAQQESTESVALKPYSSEKRDLIQKKILENPQAGKFRPSAVDAIQRKCALCEREDVIQRKEDGEMKGKSPFEMAASGFSGTPTRLPHLERIQKSFGRDMSHVEAFIGGSARMASRQLGATAYTSGNRIAFADNPSLELAAHEAAHVVQQQSGKVQLKGGVGEVGDEYERHADVVANLVVQGKSAASLLGEYGGGDGVDVQGKSSDSTFVTSETNENQDKEEGSLVAQASRSAVTCVEIDQNKIGQVLSELQTTSFVALCEEMQLLYQVLLNQQLDCKEQIEQRILIEQQPQIIKQLQEQLRQVNRQIWDFRIAAKPEPTEEDYTRMAAEFRSQYEASYTPEQIKIIQDLVGLKPAYVTGFYDESTATGVFGWQVYYRRSLYPDLPADGVVGQETLTAMVAELRKKNRAAANILAQANSSGSNQTVLKPRPPRPTPSPSPGEGRNQRTPPPGTNEDQCPTKHPGLRICDTLSAVVLQRYEPYNQNYRRFAEACKGPFGRYMYRSRNAALDKVKQITNSYINPDPYYWRDGASTDVGVCPGEGKHFAIHDKRRERGDTYVSAVLSCPCCESPQGNKIDLYALGPHDTLFEPVAEGDRQTPIGEEVASQAWKSEKRELFTS